jgi:hypothetical protein
MDDNLQPARAIRDDRYSGSSHLKTCTGLPGSPPI